MNEWPEIWKFVAPHQKAKKPTKKKQNKIKLFEVVNNKNYRRTFWMKMWNIALCIFWNVFNCFMLLTVRQLKKKKQNKKDKVDTFFIRIKFVFKSFNNEIEHKKIELKWNLLKTYSIGTTVHRNIYIYIIYGLRLLPYDGVSVIFNRWLIERAWLIWSALLWCWASKHLYVEWMVGVVNVVLRHFLLAGFYAVSPILFGIYFTFHYFYSICRCTVLHKTFSTTQIIQFKTSNSVQCKELPKAIEIARPNPSADYYQIT